MSRVPLATVAVLLVVVLWISAATLLADYVRPLHWAIQAVYFVVVGTIWVLPARALMYWAARK